MAERKVFRQHRSTASLTGTTYARSLFYMKPTIERQVYPARRNLSDSLVEFTIVAYLTIFPIHEPRPFTAIPFLCPSCKGFPRKFALLRRLLAPGFDELSCLV